MNCAALTAAPSLVPSLFAERLRFGWRSQRINDVRPAARDLSAGEAVPVGPASHRHRTRRRTLRARTLLVWMAVLVLAATAATVAILMQGQPMLADDFNQPKGLITNEFSYFQPGNPA